MRLTLRISRPTSCLKIGIFDASGLIDGVESALEPFGAWSKDPKDRVEGSRTGRMGMNGLMHAPICEHLLTHPKVMDVMNGLLGPHCRRVALKELEIFAVQPGQGKQPFHREDQVQSFGVLRAFLSLFISRSHLGSFFGRDFCRQFWPWHHEPHPWACSVLWAIDEFTPENGAIFECLILFVMGMWLDFC